MFDNTAVHYAIERLVVGSSRLVSVSAVFWYSVVFAKITFGLRFTTFPPIGWSSNHAISILYESTASREPRDCAVKNTYSKLATVKVASCARTTI